MSEASARLKRLEPAGSLAGRLANQLTGWHLQAAASCCGANSARKPQLLMYALCGGVRACSAPASSRPHLERPSFSPPVGVPVLIVYPASVLYPCLLPPWSALVFPVPTTLPPLLPS